ncbi:hypothetical protein PM082_017267 [Marasmius tenuissimus]|nr:hypothetical protein PM082_017267 [Marasmius tenuissimus]
MLYYDDAYYPQYDSSFNRRNSELAFEHKLRNSDGADEGVEEMLAEAFASMDDGATIWPDTHESHPSPITASSSSSSVGSPPRDDHYIPFTEPEEGGNDYPYQDDSDCESDADPFVQRPQLHGFVQGGKVYERSNLNQPSEVDTPFIPKASGSSTFSHGGIPAIAPEEQDDAEALDSPSLSDSEASSTASQSTSRHRPESLAIEVPRRRTLKRHFEDLEDFPNDEDDDDKNPSDDDDYCPSPTLPPRKKVRSTGASSRRNAPRLPKRRTAGATRTRMMPVSRNAQSSTPELMRAVNRRSAEECDFKCPECGWQQANKRMPDYQRHLRTHARPSSEDQSRGWWCKGICVEERDEYDIAPDAKTFYFQNRERVGGCLLTFSRRDALKRHLDNPNVSCIGRPTPANED